MEFKNTSVHIKPIIGRKTSFHREVTQRKIGRTLEVNISNYKEIIEKYKSTYSTNILISLIKISKNPKDLLDLFDNNNVNYILKYSEEKILIYFLNLCQFSEEFKIFCENQNIRITLVNSPEKYDLVSIFPLNISLEEFAILCQNDNIKKILDFGRKKNLEFLVLLCKNFDKFRTYCENDNIRYIIINSQEINLDYIKTFLKSPKDFEDICNNENIKYSLQKDSFMLITKYFKISNLEDFYTFFGTPKIKSLLKMDEIALKELSKNDIRKFLTQNTYNAFKFLEIPIEESLFNVPSHGSIFLNILISRMEDNNIELRDILNDLVEKSFIELTQNKKRFDEEEISANGKKINDFQVQYMGEQDKNIVKDLGINSNKHELSIYVRYGHTINYPEIAEAIILFSQKYINSGLSKYFSSIRIIPREKSQTVSNFLFNENTTFYPVSGKNFEIALHAFASSIFLSHSTNSSPYNSPNIISNGMKGNEGKDIISQIELQEGFSNSSFEKDNPIEVILKEFLENLIELERRLDNIISPSSPKKKQPTN